MILKDFILLGVVNNRTKFYLSALIKKNLVPNNALILRPKTILPGQKKNDLNSDIVSFFKKHNIKYSFITASNPNDMSVVKKLKRLKEPYVIYSGPGGVILRKPLFDTHKKFLHVHPGRLPDYRGSTTIYYQILAQDGCSASALFLNERIDKGPVLAVKEYPLPGRKEDMDYIYDPKIRADLLVKVIKGYLKFNKFSEKKQNKAKGDTYYIMHPVLRHIAKLKCQKQ